MKASDANRSYITTGRSQRRVGFVLLTLALLCMSAFTSSILSSVTGSAAALDDTPVNGHNPLLARHLGATHSSLLAPHLDQTLTLMPSYGPQGPRLGYGYVPGVSFRGAPVVSSAEVGVPSTLSADLFQKGSASATRPGLNASNPPAGQVNQTLVLANGSLVSGNFLASNGVFPLGEVYDPATNDVYVVDGNANLTIVNGTTGLIVETVPIPGSYTLVGIAFDSANGDLYLTNTSGVVVVSGRTNAVIAEIPNIAPDSAGDVPNDIVYDPGNTNLYIANGLAGNVTVVNDTTNSFAGSIPVGLFSWTLAYDAANGYLYVPDDTASGNLTVIDPATATTVASIPVQQFPTAIAYDGGNQCLYLSDGEGNLTVINGSSETVVTSSSPGIYPFSLVYDGQPGLLYAADGSDKLSAIDATSGLVVDTLAVAPGSLGLVTDNSNGHVFVASPSSSIVTDVNVSASGVTASVTTGTYPYAELYDPLDGDFLITNLASTNVSVVNGTTGRAIGSINVGFQPDAECLDTGNDQVYVANEGGNITVIDGYNNVVVGSINNVFDPFSIVCDSGNGNLYIAEPAGFLTTANGSLEVLGNVVEVVSASTGSMVASISLGYANSSTASYWVTPTNLTYDSANGDMYTVGFLVPTSSGLLQVYNKTIVISTLTNRVIGSFSVGYDPVAATYDGGNGFLYFADVASDNVSVVNPSNATVVKTIPVGIAPIWITYDAGNGVIYVTDYGSNNITAIQDGPDAVIGSIAVGLSPRALAIDRSSGSLSGTNVDSGTISTIPQHNASPTLSTLTFVEGGIPATTLARTGWAVEVDGVVEHSNTASIQFTVANGSYAYLILGPHAYRATPATGLLSVSGPSSLSIAFAKGATYALTFSEKGLPATGKVVESWCVSLAGDEKCSSTASLTYQNMTPGSYTYAVLSPLGGQTVTAKVGPIAYPTPNGTIDLLRSETLHFTFTYRYALTFTETGLPTGTTWSVTLRGVTEHSDTSTISFNETNGTYAYKIGTETGYRSVGFPPKVTITGIAASVTVTFTKKS